jgi:hypothetical protein
MSYYPAIPFLVIYLGMMGEYEYRETWQQCLEELMGNNPNVHQHING